MKLLSKYIAYALFFTLAILCTGCKHDPYIQITANSKCSSDLLEFVNPVVTITAQGENYTKEFTSADFVAYENPQNPLVDNIATFTKRFDTDQVSGSIAISYKLKDGVDFDNLSKETYYFSHNISYSKTISDENGFKFTINVSKDVQINNNEISKENVKSYIEKLILITDMVNFDEKINE